MAKKEKKLPEGPNMGYLVSFGDTMTALLAFFIVLNSLAKEQTGANLYSGSGSFVSAVRSLGVSGAFQGDRSKNMAPKNAPSPYYKIGDEDSQMDVGNGNDEEGNSNRSINQEVEDFERMLRAMEKNFKVTRSPDVDNQQVIDTFEKLGDDPRLNEKALKSVSEAITYLNRGNFRIEVVVWATSPAPTAVIRSIRQAADVREEIAQKFNLSPSKAKRLNATGKPWLFGDAKRPTLSMYVRRISDQ